MVIFHSFLYVYQRVIIPKGFTMDFSDVYNGVKYIKQNQVILGLIQRTGF